MKMRMCRGDDIDKKNNNLVVRVDRLTFVRAFFLITAMDIRYVLMRVRKNCSSLPPLPNFTPPGMLCLCHLIFFFILKVKRSGNGKG